MTEIERLARIVGKSLPGYIGPDQTPQAHAVAVLIVTDILIAMREPTPELIKAALVKREERDPNIDDPWWIQDWLRDRLPHLWQAMIDKLLEGK